MTSKAPATRWGIAGSGNICHDFLNALSCDRPGGNGKWSDDHRVVAVAARSLDSAKSLADRFGVPRAYQGYEQLAKDEEVDVVYVGTIHSTHKEVAITMLKAGKPVLCEKPLGLNPTEVREMLSAAKSSGVFFMEGMWMLFQPANVEMRRRMAEAADDFGQPVQLIVNFGRAIEWPRFRAAEFGGGTLLEFGVYGVYLSQRVFAPPSTDVARPSSVRCVGQLNAQGTDDGVTFVLTYPNGGTATLVYHSRTDMSCAAEVFGTKGTFKLSKPAYNCTGDLEVPGGDTVSFPVPSGAKHDFNYWNSSLLVHEADHVRECLLKGLKESPVITHQDMLTVSEILEEAKRDIGIKYAQDK